MAQRQTVVIDGRRVGWIRPCSVREGGGWMGLVDGTGERAHFDTAAEAMAWAVEHAPDDDADGGLADMGLTLPLRPDLPFDNRFVHRRRAGAAR